MSLPSFNLLNFRQAFGDIDGIMNRYYELADIAEMFPPAFLGPRLIVVKHDVESYKLSVTGHETGHDLLRLLVQSGYSGNPAQTRLLWDDKDVAEYELSLDHLGVPNGAEIATAARFQFEDKLLGGGPGGSQQHLKVRSL